MVSAATAFFLPAPALKALSRRPPCAALLRRIRTRPGSFARRLPAVVAVLALVACLAPQSPVWAAAAPAVPAHEQMKAQAPAPGHPLPVIVVRNGAEERSGRLHTRMPLHPADDQTTATQADLTATVMAAAIMAVEESRVHAVTVTGSAGPCRAYPRRQRLRRQDSRPGLDSGSRVARPDGTGA